MTDLILCLTRGGTASYPNQDGAIALAKERGTELLFLYITNVEFLDHTASAKLVDIETELDHMGDFLLAMAQERAHKAGVSAKTTVRRGDFRQVLKRVINEYPIKTVVLGSSEEGRGVVDIEYLQKLGEELCRDEGTEFIVLYEGEVVHTYLPEVN